MTHCMLLLKQYYKKVRTVKVNAYNYLLVRSIARKYNDVFYCLIVSCLNLLEILLHAMLSNITQPAPKSFSVDDNPNGPLFRPITNRGWSCVQELKALVFESPEWLSSSDLLRSSMTGHGSHSVAFDSCVIWWLKQGNFVRWTFFCSNQSKLR